MYIFHRIAHRIKGFRSAHKGSVAIYFALSLIAIITMVGLVMDYGRAMNVKTRLGAAADAAALATARDPDVTSNNLQQRAEAFFLANTQGNAFGTNYTITATELPGGNGVHVEISAKVATTLMSIAGINYFNIASQSEAVYSSSKVELALVLDNTGSMSSGGKIQTLRTASDDLIDLLIPDGAATANVKIGVVPFDIGVKVGTQYAAASWIQLASGGSNPPSGTKKKKKKKKKGGNDDDDDDDNGGGGGGSAPVWKGCVGPRSPSKDVNDSSATGAFKIPAIYDDQTSCNIAEVLPLSNDKIVLHNKISEMQPVGWTYIPEGLAWGWRVLSPSLPYPQGVAYSDPDWTKVLVLMTDGANTTTWSWSGGKPQAQTGTSSSSGNAKTATLCNNIKNAGIIIYTVAFKVSSNSTQQMMENCATTPGNYFDAQNNAALEAAFAKIGGDISNLRLSK